MDLKNTDEDLENGFNIVICPIWGAKTLDSNWICEHCGWEYDDTLDENLYSSVNKATVREYAYKQK